MGYTTDFTGSFMLDKPLTDIQIEYLNMFADTRRMKRDEFKVAAMKAAGKGNTRCFELLEELGLPIGSDGDFYCGTGLAGQDGGHFNSALDNSVVEYNFAPGEGRYGDINFGKSTGGQPGLWCQWNPSEDGTEIVWDGSEKFYHYTEWLEYLITNFLKPWGYKVNGMVEWRGEDNSDIGVLEVVDNVVTAHSGKTIAHLEDSRKPVAVAPVEIAAKASNTPEIVLDLVKLRNDLATSKKGTAVACKKLDELIKKYGV